MADDDADVEVEAEAAEEAAEVEVELEDEVEAEAEAEADFGGAEEAEVDAEAAAAALVEGDDEVMVEEEEPAEPAEPEVDDLESPSALPRLQRPVAFAGRDATPNVFYSPCGILSSLSQGPFAQLLSGARADTGVKAGRYLFEAQVLELAPRTQLELRIGFSLPGSSLFLGDGSPEGVGFGRDGTYFVAEPGQVSSMHRAEACSPLRPRSVIGVLLNLDPSSKAANTLSLFLDGERAGPPQPIPSHLRGKALYPTVTFRGISVAVNFGGSGLQLRQLPFACTMLGRMAAAHAEAASSPPEARREVVFPVALPDAGFFDCVRRLQEAQPELLELSERKVAAWCAKSGLKPKHSPGTSHSVDRPCFDYGHAPLDGKGWRETLLTLAQMAGRSCLIAELGQNLVREEREAMLRKFPASVKKVAVVSIGAPSQAFRQWVHDTLKAEREAKQALAERRQLLAEASGVAIDEAQEPALPPEPPSVEEARFLPREDPEVPDVSAEALAEMYTKFSLPLQEEGFDEVRFEWSQRAEAEKLVRNWVLERKATFLVKGLKPGDWFKAKLDLWKVERKQLRDGHLAYVERRKSEGLAAAESESGVDLASVADIHDADGRGTPLYSSFKYEDWLLLGWRYELHLLAHAFLADVADDDIPGIPEDHVPYYFELYFGHKFEPKEKLGVTGVTGVVQLLKDPVELAENPNTTGPRLLRSALKREEPLASFVKGVEAFRRDRKRRLEAGDESAQLSFPKPSKAKAPPAKAAPKGAKAPAPAKALPAKAAPPGLLPGRVPGVMRPPLRGVRPPIAKAAPPGLRKPIAKAPPSTGAVKRPAPAELAGAPPTKRPVPAAGAAGAKSPIAKAPIAKRKPAPRA